MLKLLAEALLISVRFGPLSAPAKPGRTPDGARLK